MGLSSYKNLRKNSPSCFHYQSMKGLDWEITVQAKRANERPQDCVLVRSKNLFSNPLTNSLQWAHFSTCSFLYNSTSEDGIGWKSAPGKE